MATRSPIPDELPAAVDICGLPVRPVDLRQLLDALVGRARQGRRTRAHYLNAHTFNLTLDRPEFRQILATCELLYADGMSVVWASRWLGRPLPQRLSAADYFETFAQRCAAAQVSVFLLGGQAGVADAAATTLKKRVSGLKIAGTHDGYFQETDSEAVVTRISAARPDILLVGLGSPRQEEWIERWHEQLEVPVCWSVGALFDYFAEREPRAPQWLCRHGGEWIFRLMHRPSERWRRYLVGNARFVWAVLNEGRKGHHRPRGG